MGSTSEKISGKTNEIAGKAKDKIKDVVDRI